MSGLLFITVKGADNDLVNGLLKDLYDDEYDSGDRFHVVTKNDPKDAIPRDVEETPAGSYTKDNPFLDKHNYWAGADITKIEKFVLESYKTAGYEAAGLFLMLDQEGLDNKTVIVAYQDYDIDANKKLNKFSKLRLPWRAAYSMWCNLDIVNMDFDEFVEEDEEGNQDKGDKDGWYKPNDFAKEEKVVEE